jgi:protein-S-isoprenylcysteine O-methyltransferase Ste14
VVFLKRNIEQDGKAPINRTLFYVSKYSILVVWGAMVLQSWGIGISLVEVPRTHQLFALLVWACGFAFMYAGRFAMRDSFRLGTPKEDTSLRTDGLFGISRNPMYVGVYLTIAASSLYTVNPLVILTGVFVIAVHHRIVRAEEKHLRNVFGRKYSEYCSQVRQYI